MLTFEELEQLAKTLLKHLTPEETQYFLDMDMENKLLWIKYKIVSLEVQV
ncbi:hypothetical protein [Streptococcus suis]|nr:hypothetical protein [Streptococcus suis]MCO8220302.1 hypothetical protein [Streptococcus suis]HEM3511617.1 hypothetical protein [Streptococcus suis]HEM3526647.1 hypothetical protein [Streptococcus suis]HEM6534486.1 hypothetical protein [Streptococcus suis]HEM6561128.1 hypothetical protein [Streptococcus suis]